MGSSSAISTSARPSRGGGAAALSGRERREVEIHGFVVGSASAQNADRKFFALRHLSHVVLERNLRHGVNDGLIAGVGDGAIEIADGNAHKVLRGAGLQVREFQVRGISGRWGGLFLLGAKNQRENADHYSYDDDADENRSQAGLFRLRRGIRVRLDQAAHGGIVLPATA